MSFAELKAEVDRLTSEEREQLENYLQIRKKMENEDLRNELAQKIDDKNPANWITLEEAEKRLFPKN